MTKKPKDKLDLMQADVRRAYERGKEQGKLEERKKILGILRTHNKLSENLLKEVDNHD